MYPQLYFPPPQTNKNKKKVIIIIIVIVLAIVVVLLMNNSSTTPNNSYTTPTGSSSTTPNNNDSAEFYSECNFEKSKELDNSLPKKISISEIKNSMIYGNVHIKSIKSKGYKLFLYEDYDFEGEPLIIDEKNEYINTCFEKPIQSIKVFKQ